jgi:hypothetical protein
VTGTRGGIPLRTAPAGGESPSGFHPFVKPVPGSGRESAGGPAEYRHAAAVRAIHGDPSGAQCRRMTVFCLPGTMPDRDGMNKGEIRNRERER